MPLATPASNPTWVRWAKSAKRQALIVLGNIESQANMEVREAMEKLKYSAQELISTGTNLRLSLKEMELARLRFFTGVGDNLEVVQAQASLARARDDRINALADYNSARISLATATGMNESFQL